MRDFVTCLEFLTRIRFSNRTDWHDDDFSRSVPYFPLVGLVMGVFMGAVNYGLYYLHTPDLMRAVMLVLAVLGSFVSFPAGWAGSVLSFLCSPVVLVVAAGVAGLCIRAAKGGLRP